MKIKFTLQRPGTPPADLVVTADAITTVGGLAMYLAKADQSASSHLRTAEQLTLGVVEGDTRALDPRVTLVDSGLRSGSTVSLTLGGSTYRDPKENAAAVITVTSGPDTGKEFAVHHGTNIIGRERGCEVRLSDPLVSRQHARVNVTDLIEVVDVGSSNGLLVGESVVPRTVLRPGDTVQIGDTALTARMLAPARLGSAAETTNVSYIRSPRLDPIYEGEKFEAPEPPELQRSQRFPMLTVIASLLMGAVLFVVTKSLLSVVFIALTPLLLIATTFESRMEARAHFRQAVAQFREDIASLIDDARRAIQDEVIARNREHPSLADCVEATRRMSPLVWTRRPAEHGFSELKLGSGRQPSRSKIELPSGTKAPRYLLKELMAAVAPFAVVDGVPIVADPGQRGGIGIAGPRQTLLAAARALLVQAAVLHSPAELVIAGIASSRTAPDWDWMKWLPHTTSAHSPIPVRQLASTAPTATTLISELEDLIAHRVAMAKDRSAAEEGHADTAVLLLVEYDAPAEQSRLVELAERGWKHGVYVLWLATDLALLSAACRTFVEVGHESATGAAGFVHSGESVMPLLVELVDLPTAQEVARILSPLVDIGARVSDDSDLPRAVSLVTLTGSELANSPEAVIERWTENRSILTGPFAPPTPVRHAGTLRAVIGQSATEAHALDLRADGPHALVGGTTGSGKSELLQTWILSMAAAHSPQRLSFLLVDYKGGSAFRDCTELPHTIGLVTDLSPHLVRRALTSLSAELRYREHILAQHAAKDLVTLEKQGVLDAPPSLVIVVDEFAALVTEVPEFVDGVVDVAQRGRSLGLHLILATQRPAGVIKDNLRANTNLRLALRMADEDDSSDVLGSPEAAFFDQALPGRAVSKTGPGRLIPFQSGYAGGWTTDEPPPPELLVEELTFGPGRIWELVDTEGLAVDDSGPTDIRRMVTAVGQASEMAQIPIPRKPWLPELRAVYDLADQSQVRSRRRDTELVFGVRDDPESQAQPTVAFFPDKEGHLAVFGTGGSGKSTLLRTIAIAAGFTVRGGPCHVYGIDFGARGLAMLEVLPHVGSIISGGDHERIARLIEWLRALIDERALRYSAVNAGTIADYRELAGVPDEPRVLLLVDGIAAFRQAYDASDRVRWFDMFEGVVTDGRPVGVHVVLASEQRMGLTPVLSSAVQSRVVLRMSTPDDYGMLDVPSDVLDSDSPAGRGLFGESETQVAVLGGATDVLAQANALDAFAESMVRAGASAAPPIRSLPETVSLLELPPTVDGLPVIGLSGATLGPLTMPNQGSYLIAGPPGSGRTTTLHAVVYALRRANPAVRLYYFGQRRSSLAQLDVWAQCTTGVSEVADVAAELAEELPSLSSTDAPLAVIIENVGEFVDGIADSALQDLARVCLAEDNLLVIDGEISALASSYGLLGSAKVSRSGLALQPDDDAGPMLYRTNFPRMSRMEMPPGRGMAVRLGKPELAQIGLPPM